MKYQDSEIGYAAGLFDTIGSIKIIIPKTGEEHASLLVWITSSNFQIIEFLQRLGAFVDRKDAKQFRAKWKNYKAYVFLKLIKPFLRNKQDQAELGIEFFDSKLKNDDPKNYVLPLKARLKLLKRDDLDN